MRILFCNYEYPPLGGGGGAINALLAEELARRHEVTVLTSHGPGLPLQSIEDGVRIIRVPVYFRKQKSVASLLSMLAFVLNGIGAGRTLLKGSRYDVINTHFVVPTGPVGNALARATELPNVLSLHGGDLYDPSKLTSPHRNPVLRILIRHLLHRADIVVGQSSNTINNMRQYYASDVEAVRVPLGIRRPATGAASRNSYGCLDGDVLLVTIGRLVARKAVMQLIRVISALRNDGVRLLIVGSGPQEELLKREAARRQLGGQILFLGQVSESEKFRILRMCDLYVSTSQHEGFGLVFLEAMACALPIVCYDHGGQTDFLGDQETGHVVPLNDLELFTQRCDSLIKNPMLRRTVGEHNQRLVEEFYIDRCASTYEDVFSLAIEGRARKEAARALRSNTAERSA